MQVCLLSLIEGLDWVERNEICKSGLLINSIGIHSSSPQIQRLPVQFIFCITNVCMRLASCPTCNILFDRKFMNELYYTFVFPLVVCCLFSNKTGDTSPTCYARCDFSTFEFPFYAHVSDRSNSPSRQTHTDYLQHTVPHTEHYTLDNSNLLGELH